MKKILPVIAAMAIELPEHEFTQERAIAALRSWYASADKPDLPVEKAVQVFENAGVKTRRSVMPVEDLLTPKPLGDKNRRYIEEAKWLGEAVAARALEEAKLKASDVDFLITLSCTGFMIPSLDAYLMNRLPFRANVGRLPITELGCAAGVAALRLTRDLLAGKPDANVLVVSVELPTLTFQPTDFSGDHIVSCAIFGDGASAMILSNRKGLAGWRVAGADTHFFPKTADFMGFDLEETGFHIFLSPRIPVFIRKELMPVVKRMAERESGDRPIAKWLAHPGGPKILDAIEEALGMPMGGLAESRAALRDHGNISSTTVLSIMRKHFAKGGFADGERTALVAVGPGFQLEFALLEYSEG